MTTATLRPSTRISRGSSLAVTSSTITELSGNVMRRTLTGWVALSLMALMDQALRLRGQSMPTSRRSSTTLESSCVVTSFEFASRQAASAL